MDGDEIEYCQAHIGNDEGVEKCGPDLNCSSSERKTREYCHNHIDSRASKSDYRGVASRIFEIVWIEFDWFGPAKYELALCRNQ